MDDVLRALVLVAPATVAVIETFRLCPLVRLAHDLLAQMRKSTRVVMARGISEHWKERVLPAYAAVMLRTSLMLGGWIVALLGIFAIALQLTGSAIFGRFDALIALARVDYALYAMVVAVVYLGLKHGLKRVAGYA